MSTYSTWVSITQFFAFIFNTGLSETWKAQHSTRAEYKVVVLIDNDINMENFTAAITHSILNNICKVKGDFLPGENPAGRYRKLVYFLVQKSVVPSSLLSLSLSKDIRMAFNHIILEPEKTANRNTLSIKTAIKNLFCYHLLMLNMAVSSNSVLWYFLLCWNSIKFDHRLVKANNTFKTCLAQMNTLTSLAIPQLFLKVLFCIVCVVLKYLKLF